MGGDEFLGKSNAAFFGNLDEASGQVKLSKFKLTIPQVGRLPMGSPQTWETSKVSPGLCPKIRTVWKESSILPMIFCSMPTLAK